MEFENVNTSPVYKETVHILNVFSGDRDISIFPSPSSYSIRLLEKIGKTYRNVKSVRLLSGIFPDINDITQEPFLSLNIGDGNDNVSGTSQVLNNSSAIIQLDKPLETGFFFNIKTDICRSMRHVYNQPIAELSKIDIDLRDCLGGLFNFGTDVGTVDKSIQHLLTFEIITETRQYSSYNNVY